MNDDQLFGLVAMAALLLWLGARLVPDRHRATVERIAFALIGGGIVVAVFFTVLHFLG